MTQSTWSLTALARSKSGTSMPCSTALVQGCFMLTPCSTEVFKWQIDMVGVAHFIKAHVNAPVGDAMSDDGSRNRYNLHSLNPLAPMLHITMSSFPSLPVQPRPMCMQRPHCRRSPPATRPRLVMRSNCWLWGRRKRSPPCADRTAAASALATEKKTA